MISRIALHESATGAAQCFDVRKTMFSPVINRASDSLIVHPSCHGSVPTDECRPVAQAWTHELATGSTLRTMGFEPMKKPGSISRPGPCCARLGEAQTN